MFDCPSPAQALSGLNARAGRSVCYNNLLPHQAVNKKGHEHNPVSRILLSMGHFEHNCIVNAMLHHVFHMSSSCHHIMQSFIFQALINGMKMRERSDTDKALKCL